MSSDRRVLNRISPIRMNIGSAVRSQPIEEVQSAEASVGPGGAGVISTMATKPMKPSAIAIHTPVARIRNRRTMTRRRG